jgi:hypothetical protein
MEFMHFPHPGIVDLNRLLMIRDTPPISPTRMDAGFLYPAYCLLFFFLPGDLLGLATVAMRCTASFVNFGKVFFR